MTALLDQFLSHTIASTEIPYCQIISPPNLKSAELEKWVKSGGLNQIGFFVKASEAEKAEFTPDDSWQPYEASLGDGSEVGFISNSPKFCIIHKSQREVQFRPSEEDRFSFVGLVWENGSETEFAKAAAADTNKLYKIVTRYLLLFLGANNQPLHNAPIQYTAKGAFAGSLYAETTELYKQLSKVYFARLRLAGKQANGGMLSPFALAFAKVDITIGFSRNKPTESPFCVPTEIAFPSFGDNVGVDLELYRKKGDRKIILHGVALENAMIDMTSEAGKLIQSWHSEYKSFPKPRRELPKFEGRVTFSDIMHQDNGDILAKIPDGRKCRIPSDLAHIVMGGEYEISGVIDGNTIVIKTAEPFDDGFSGRDQMPDESEVDGDW
ncbi:MAG: DUF5895 domain-containing protein [Dolichospermum sp.]